MPSICRAPSSSLERDSVIPDCDRDVIGAALEVCGEFAQLRAFLAELS
jgi:hypothetical protein